jgi:hypothetical protein
VNHDLYRRALDAPGSQLVMLLGEGTFHQMHGGAATSGRFAWEEMAADYEQVRGHPYTAPEQHPVYLGTIPPAARRHLLTSIGAIADGGVDGPPDRAGARRSLKRLRRSLRPGRWMPGRPGRDLSSGA